MEFFASIGILAIIYILFRFAIQESFSKPESEESKRRRLTQSLMMEGERKVREKCARLRVAAYEYEDFLYDTFSPFVTRLGKQSTGYYYYVSGSADLEYVLNHIKRCPQFKGQDPQAVLQMLIDKELIEKTKTGYSLGLVLETYGDVISKDDMTLAKWMTLHNEKGGE